MSNSKLVNYTKISPNRTSPRQGKISKIVVHHMAGNLSVESCGAVFAPASRRASSHYGIDSQGRIGQYCYEENRAWTTGNKIDHQAVTIEVADDIIGNGWHSSAKALSATVTLCADICKRNGITKLNYTGNKGGNLLMHKWYQATDCPGNYLGSQFTWIAQEVNKVLAGGKATLPTNVVADSYRPESKGYLMKGDYGQAVKVMQQMLVKCGYSVGKSGIDGSFGGDTLAAVKKFQKDAGLVVDGFYGAKTKAALTAKYNATFKSSTSTSTSASNTGSKEKLKVDGLWGTKTTKRAQQVFGCKIVDGIISNQWKVYKNANPGLTSGWEWKDKPNGNGSNLIREIQRWAGMPEKEIDGEVGNYTFKSIQAKLGCKIVDGYMSNPSNCIKAFQTWLNNQ